MVEERMATKNAVTEPKSSLSKAEHRADTAKIRTKMQRVNSSSSPRMEATRTKR